MAADDRYPVLYHLTRRADWEAALAEGEYRLSTLGLTLDEVGFVHCARDHQVAGVAERFFSGQSDLVLLEIDPTRLDAEIRHEAPTDGDETFPHLYGPLPTAAVVRVEPYPPPS